MTDNLYDELSDVQLADKLNDAQCELADVGEIVEQLSDESQQRDPASPEWLASESMLAKGEINAWYTRKNHAEYELHRIMLEQGVKKLDLRHATVAIKQTREVSGITVSRLEAVRQLDIGLPARTELEASILADADIEPHIQVVVTRK